MAEEEVQHSAERASWVLLQPLVYACNMEGMFTAQGHQLLPIHVCVQADRTLVIVLVHKFLYLILVIIPVNVHLQVHAFSRREGIV